jgi:hypothetical protein
MTNGTDPQRTGTSALAGRLAMAMIALSLVCSGGCSRSGAPGDDATATEGSVTRSEAALIAARALFEEGQIEAAQARLDADDPRHTELRGQIEEELRRRAMGERFGTWSVGPAKMTRSIKRTRQICQKRGGAWLTVNEGLSVCNQGEKIAAVRTRDGNIVVLTGFYSSKYVATENPGLYENEARLLREAFGEPHAPGEELKVWWIPDDRTISLGHDQDGNVLLMVGMTSELPSNEDEIGTLLASIGEALAQESSGRGSTGTSQIAVSTISRTVCANGDEIAGQPKNDTLHWVVTSDGTIRAQLESAREGQATRDFWIEGRARGRSVHLEGTNVVYIFGHRQVWHYELIGNLTSQGDFENGRFMKAIEGGDCSITQRIKAR